MKKLFLVLLMFLYMSGMIFSQEYKADPTKTKSRIKVTYPKAGMNFNASNTCLIRWDRPGIQNIKAKIILLKSTGEKVKVIAEAANNTGKYWWRIPYTLEEGSYKIRVKAGTLAHKSGVFTTKTPSFNVYNPGGNDYLTIGDKCVILWSHQNAKDVIVQLSIYIYKGKERKTLLTNIQGDKGMADWTVGKYNNGNDDIWDISTYPDYALKCRIEIYLQDAYSIFYDKTQDFWVRK